MESGSEDIALHLVLCVCVELGGNAHLSHKGTRRAELSWRILNQEDGRTKRGGES